MRTNIEYEVNRLFAAVLAGKEIDERILEGKEEHDAADRESAAQLREAVSAAAALLAGFLIDVRDIADALNNR